MTLSALVIILQLIYLESILSVDNAAVLAAMVRRLPRDEPIPWPRVLRFAARSAHRVLGGQRLAALKVGLLGAYVGRGVMLILAVWVIHNRWLLLVGGLYLIRLAVDHLGERPQGARSASRRGAEARGERGYWGVVLALDLFHIRLGDVVKFAISLGTVLLSVVYGQRPSLQQMGRRLMWLKRSLGYVALLFDYVLKPISWIAWGIVTFLRAVGARRRHGRAAPASSI